MNFCSIKVLLFLFGYGKLARSTQDAARIEPNYGELVQYRDGDIIIAFAIPVSNSINEVCDKTFNKYGVQMVEEVNMVIEEINSNDDILPGLKLGTIMIDTCYLASHALKKIIFDVLRKFVINDRCEVSNCSKEHEQQKILAGVVGAVSSSVSIQIAIILQAFSISQISILSTSPDLSDKSRFKYFFRTVPSDNHQTSAMAEFIKKMKWNFVSIVYENNAYGVRGYTELVSNLKKRDICIATALAVDTNAEDARVESIVQEILKKKEARAIILFMGSRNAEKLIHAASRVKGLMEEVLWIGSDAWVEYYPPTGATEEVRKSVAGSVGFKPKYYLKKGLTERIRNLTLASYKDETLNLNPWWPKYISSEKNCSLPNDSDIAEDNSRICSTYENVSDFAPFRPIEDGVMAFVQALNLYHRDICKNKSGLCDELSNSAGTNKVAIDLYPYLKNVSFRLEDGEMFFFDENQDGPAVYKVLVYEDSNNSWVHAGMYNMQDTKGFGNNISFPYKVTSTQSVCSKPCKIGQAREMGKEICCWFCHNCTIRQYVSSNRSSCIECPHGRMPNKTKDGCEEIPLKVMEPSSKLAIASITVGAFGLVCTFLVTGVYLVFRDTAIVRASGKELCFFVLFGVFLTLLNCFPITTTPTRFTCATSRVILAMGPACMYAGLLTKTLRIVFIFQSKRLLSMRTKAYLEPIPLLLITLCVVIVQVIILSIWLVIHIPGNETKYFENDAFLTCSHFLELELFVGLAYPFILIIVGTVFATINRNVPTGFRETLFVGFAMYTTCVTWIAFASMFLTNYKDIFRQLTTVSIALSVSAITVLFSIFVPRCYTMIFHPETNTSESVMSNTGSFSAVQREQQGSSAAGKGNPAYSSKQNTTE